MPRGEVLVAILNNKMDFLVAKEEHWYRIPVSSAKKWLTNKFPPQWIAFYQTKIFGTEAHSVQYFAQVLEVRRVFRWQLFPNEPADAKSRREYYQLILAPLQIRQPAIPSRRLRRIVFIPTTWQKFTVAEEINDLYAESSLEERLWDALKLNQISAERQEFIELQQGAYALDFAIYCMRGRLAIETDGDTWHANPEKSAKDNIRDNALKSAGWQVVRFSQSQIQEQLETYCVPTIVQTIDTLGGLDTGTLSPRKIDPDAPSGSYQLGLFD